jgi:hypothetical protein
VAGDLVLQSRPAISCHSIYYRTIQPIAIILLSVLIIGVPVVMLILMWRYRHELTSSSGSSIRLRSTLPERVFYLKAFMVVGQRLPGIS